MRSSRAIRRTRRPPFAATLAAAATACTDTTGFEDAGDARAGGDAADVGDAPDAQRCAQQQDCDDRVDCTLDTCDVSGACAHVAQNNRCSAGQMCNPTMGCVVTSACGSDAACDDHVYCDGTETCSTELACVAGTPVDCDDHDPCTTDACSEAMRACTHAANPACMMVRSGIYDVAPAPMYSCSAIDGTPVVDFDIMHFQFAITGGTLTVTGAPATMTVSVPTAADFDVTGVIAGGCPETYRLMGTFTDATHFHGTFTASYGPGADCGFTDCTNHSFTVMGTAAM